MFAVWRRKESWKDEAQKIRRPSPEVDQLKKELRRTKYNADYRRTLRSTFFALVIVAAASILVAVLILPVLQINGNSMAPSLADGDVVVCLKPRTLSPGMSSVSMWAASYW